RYGFDERQVSFVFVGVGVNMIIVQGLLVRWLVPRLGERRLVIIGSASLCTGMALLFFGYAFAALCASVFFVSLGNGLVNPSLTSLISRSAPGDRQGGVLGVAQGSSALARVFGPLTGGSFLRFGNGVPFLVGSVIMGLATGY